MTRPRITAFDALAVITPEARIECGQLIAGYRRAERPAHYLTLQTLRCVIEREGVRALDETTLPLLLA